MKRIFTQIIYITLLLALTLGASAQNEWEALNGPFGGRVDRMYGSGTTLYMKSDREYFKSTDTGTSWVKMQTLPGSNVEDLAVSGTKLYALEYSRLSVSQDGGTTWLPVSNNLFFGVYQIKITSKGTIFVFGWNGMYVSIDEGLSWRQIMPGNSYADRFVFNSSGDVFFRLEAYTEETGWEQSVRRILYPGDGNTYEEATVDLILDPPQFYIDNGLIRDSAYWLWDLKIDGNDNLIFLDTQEILGSSNNGDSWTSLRGTTLLYGDESAIEGRLAVTPNGRIYIFKDLGVRVVFTKSSIAADDWFVYTDNWPTGENNDGINFILPVDNNTILAGSNNFGPFKTVNATTGLDWAVVNTGMTALFGDNILVTSTNRIIYFKRGIRGYYYSDNGGTSWLFRDLISTLTNNIENIVKLSDGKLLLTAYNKIFTSVDDGNIWLPVLENGLNEGHARHYENMYVLDDNTFYMTGYHFYPTDKHVVSKTEDQGVTWTQVTLSGLPSDFATWYPLSIAATTNGTIFFGLYNFSESQDQLWQGKEGVATKVSFPGQVNDYFYPRGLFVQNGTNVYASNGEALFSSKDSGETWARLNIFSNALIDLGDGIGVSRQGTFQVTQDDGKTWSNTSIPGAYITAIAKNVATNTFFASSSRSAYKYTQDLIIDPALLPPFIDFNWEPVAGGPYGGNARDIIITNEGKQFGLINNRVYQTDNPNNAWTDIITGTNHTDFRSLAYHKGSSKAYLSGYYAGAHNIGYRQDGLDWQLFGAQPAGDYWSRKLFVADDGALALYRGWQEGFFVWDVDHWEKFLDGSFFESVFKDSEGIWYAAGYIPGVGSRFVKRSTDNGLTWGDLDLNVINNEVIRFRENNVGDVIAFSPFGLAVLDKDLDVWTSLNQNIGAGNFFGGNGDFIVGPNNEYFLFSIHLQKAFKSLDKGLTWEEIDFPSQGALVINATFEGTNIHLSVNPQGYFYSTNLGESWIKNSVGYGRVGQSNIFHIGGDEFVISSNFGSVYRTTDAGTNWEISPTSQGIYNLKKHPDGYLLGHGTVLKKSTDNGLTWQTLFDQTSVWQFAISEAGVAYASNTQVVFFSTDPELETWTQLNITGLPTSSNIRNMSSDINGGLYLIVYDNADNQNKAYQVVFGSAIRINLPTQQNPSSFQYFNGKVYLFTQDGTLRESIDGSSWTTYTTPSGAYFTFEQNGDYWLVHGWSGVVWLSRDAGQTWQNTSSTNTQLIFNDIVISKADGRAYAAVNNSVHKSGNVVLPNDGQNPVITEFDPAHEATGVALQPTLRIVFDEVITAVPEKNLRIHDASQSIVVPPVEIISVESGNKIDNVYEFTLTSTLALNKTYFVTLDNEAFTDIFGNPATGFPSSTSTWRFTTIPEPTVTALSPEHESNNIELKPSLEVTFSNTIYPVEGKYLHLFDQEQQAEPLISISLSEGIATNNTISFDYPIFSTTEVTIDPSNGTDVQEITITFNALGTPLVGLTKVYAHAGVIIDSPEGNEWAFVKGNWGADDGVGEMTNIGDDVWELVLTPTLREYFEVPDDGTEIYSLALVFRNAEGSLSTDPDYFIRLGEEPDFSVDPLDFSRTYIVRFDNEAFSAGGENRLSVLNDLTSWNFNTRDKPSITAQSPEQNAVDVELDLTFSFTLSDPVSIVDGKNIALFNAADPGEPVFSTSLTNLNQNENTYSIVLPESLEYSTSYFVRIDEESFTYTEREFSLVTGETDWTFTTRAIPAIASLTPVNNASDVGISSAVSIVFAEAVGMDPDKSVRVYSASDVATPVYILPLSTANQTGNTIQLAADLAFDYDKEYLIRVDGEAFNVQGKVFTVLNTDSDWKFKTIPPPDTQSPSIATPSGLNIEKGAGTKAYNITITDNTAVESGKIFYRGILTNSNTAFTEGDLTAPTTGAVYTVNVPETAFDALGLEFYITALDAAGNAARNPSAANQYLYSYINFPSAQAPKITGLPTSGTETNYRIISASYELSSTTVTSAFQSLGSYNKIDWRMYRLPAGTSSYVEHGTGFSTLNRGEAYWMISKTAEFAIEGASTPPNNRNSLFSFSLVPGWNMVGNPYPVAINWADVKGAASNVGNLNVYNGGWQTGNTMAPNTGGFVFVTGSAPPLVAPLPGVNSGGRKDNIDPGSKLDNEHWELPLTLIHGEVRNELPGIGMHPQAKEQFDQFDIPTLPRLFDYAELNSERNEPLAPYFTKDVVPTQNEYVWEFSMASNQEGLATLSWNNSDLGYAKDLVLFDVSKQLIVDMRAINSYTFDPKSSNLFRIHFGDNLGESLKPDRVMLGNTYPNPSQGEAIVPFAISAEAGEVAVLMELYSNLGVKVGTLVDGKFEPGFHEAPIDAKTRGLSSGMYLIKLSVAGEELRETYYTKWVLNK